jgi:hypothetical protein
VNLLILILPVDIWSGHLARGRGKAAPGHLSAG